MTPFILTPALILGGSWMAGSGTIRAPSYCLFQSVPVVPVGRGVKHDPPAARAMHDLSEELGMLGLLALGGRPHGPRLWGRISFDDRRDLAQI